MSTTWVKCPGPRRMSTGLKQQPKGLCSECQTEIPIKRGKFVRHLVKLNGRRSPIAGSGEVPPKARKRPVTPKATKVAPKARKRRKRRW